MAELRLILVIGLAACGWAGAAPSASSSGIAAPAGWQALPELAAATKDAVGAGVVGAEAWAETAMGCYGVWLAMAASGESVADQIVDGFATAKLAVRDVVKPTGAGVLSLTFERAPYRGRLRARLGNDQIIALACFANQREPIACESACTGLLGAIP